MKRFFLFSLLAGALGLAGCIRVESTSSEPVSSTQQGANAEMPAAPAGGKLITLSVEGMSCPLGCAPVVEETLAGLQGVTGVKVIFDKKEAVVAVKDSGFDASQLETALASTDKFTGKVKG